MNSNANGSHVLSKKNSIALLRNFCNGRKLQFNNVLQRIFLWLYLTRIQKKKLLKTVYFTTNRV